MKKFFSAHLLLVLSFCASAQVDTLIYMPSFTVQGIQDLDTLHKSPKNAYVIPALELKNAAVQSTNDVLDYGTGLDVRTRSGLGAQADLNIRAGSFDQSLVLIDGVKMSDPQTGHHLMNLPIEIENIERVEQISNGGSRWFGPYAFSGAVNLITKVQKESNLRVRLSGGEFGYFDAGVSGTVAHKNTSTTISVSRRSTEGYIPNTDFELINVALLSNLKFKKVDVKINGGQTERKFGAQNFYTSAFPTQYEETKAQFVSAQGLFKIGAKEKFRITPRVYYRRHYDQFQLYRTGSGWYEEKGDFLIMGNDTAAAWYAGPNYHKTEVKAGELNASYDWFYGRTSIGAEYRHEGVLSNNLGEPLENNVEDIGGAVYSKSAERENASLFFEHNLHWKRLRVSAGMLANFHSVYGEDIFPGIDVGVDLTKNITAFGGISKNSRFPTFTDLYYRLGGAIGSINLLPEQSVNYQVGGKYLSNKFRANLTFFVRDAQNLIDWVRYNGSTITEAANITSVFFYGLEFDSYFNLKNIAGEDFFFNGIYIRAAFTEADKNSEGFESNYSLDFLNSKVYGGIDHQVSKTITARWSITHQNRKGGYFDAALGKEVVFEPYALLDFRLTHEKKGLRFYAEVANLFDQQYVDIGNVQQPGRWLRIGASYQLTFKKKPEATR